MQVDVEIEAGAWPSRTERQDRPFGILVLGNFSGMAGAARREPVGRAIKVDLDNFDDTIRAMRPHIELRVPGVADPIVPVAFEEFDDFHPDALYRRLPVFKGLERSRKQAPPLSAHPSPTLGPGLLDAILAEQSPVEHDHPVEYRNLGSKGWDEALQRIVAPHAVPAEDPNRIRSIQETAGEIMRAILHDPAFQEVEAAWRSVDFLLRRLDTDGAITLEIADCDREALHDGGLLRHLLADGTQRNVVVSLYQVEAEPSGIEALARLGHLARGAGVMLLTSIHPRMVGVKSFSGEPDASQWNERLDGETAKAWENLRAVPESKALGLVLPRFLLRIPYGRDTSTVESFEFEEMPDTPDPENYLWGNGAVACSYVMAARTQGERSNQIERIPVHTYRANGEAVMTPCAEIWLTERAADKLLDAGIMPLASIKGRDSIWMPQLRSLHREA